MPDSHVITAIVNGQQIGGWTSGSIESSMITPADSFVLRMPFALSAWHTLRRDSHITIRADGVTMLDGFIDRRIRQGKAGVIEIHGRDRVGRLLDESAPAINYTGLTIKQAIERLISPWFSGDPIISNADNRRLRRGKGRRVAAPTEPVVTINVRVPRKGKVHPGESRWQIIHEIVSRAGLIAYSSSDGKQFFVGKANPDQAPQYLFTLGAPGSSTRTTVKDLIITEDDGDRFSLYMTGGVGGQSDVNYGSNVVARNGVVFDNPFNRADGTGRDFLFPKRMYLPERAFEDFHDADRVARLEQQRRDMKRHVVSIHAATFGQNLGSSSPTLFAPDTVARVIDEEIGLDDLYLIYACTYSFARDTGDFTTMHCVPQGTEIVL